MFQVFGYGFLRFRVVELTDGDRSRSRHDSSWQKMLRRSLATEKHKWPWQIYTHPSTQR